MIFIPMPQQTTTQTRHSRELSRRFDQVVRDYQRDHPELTDAEIRAALAHSAATSDDGDTPGANRRIAVLGIAAALGVAGAVVAATQGSRGSSTDFQWPILTIIIAIAAVGVAVTRLKGRGRD